MTAILQKTFIILLNDIFYLLIEISLKFVTKSLINKKPALGQIMDWHETGDKPLSESMMLYFIDTYMHHAASIALNLPVW